MEKNNLATIEYARGNIEQALSILEPYLETDSTVESPYTLGLAAQLYAQLGRRNEAERLLKQAVKAFQKNSPTCGKKVLIPIPGTNTLFSSYGPPGFSGTTAGLLISIKSTKDTMLAG